MNQMEIKRKQSLNVRNICFAAGFLIYSIAFGDYGAGYLFMLTGIVLLWILCFGVPLSQTVEKVVRCRIQKGRKDEYFSLLHLFGGYGIIHILFGCVFLILCSFLFKNGSVVLPCLSSAFLILVPGYVFFILSQILRGYFQGIGSTVPTVFSQNFGAVVWLLSSTFFSCIFYRYGMKVSDLLNNEQIIYAYPLFGIATGFDLSAFLAFLFLLILYFANTRKSGTLVRLKHGEHVLNSFKILLKELLPNFILNSGFYVLLIAGLLIFQFRYSSIISLNDSIAFSGAFYGKFLMFELIPVYFINSFLIPVQYKVAGFFHREECSEGRELFQTGLHYILVSGLFFTFVFGILGGSFFQSFHMDFKQIGNFFYSLSVLIVLIPMNLFIQNILYSLGYRKKVFFNNFLGLLAFSIYFAVTYFAFKISIPLFTAGFSLLELVILILNLFCSIRFLRLKFRVKNLLVFPFVSASLIGVIVFLLNKALIVVAGPVFSFLTCLIVAVIGYVVLLLAFHCLECRELSEFPGGLLIIRIGEFLKLL